MARDRKYIPGSFYRLDDRTGFKERAENTRWEWDGLLVSPKVWEPRQPQDFVRGVRDVQNVPQPRPRQTDQFTILGTWVTAFTPRLQSTVQVKTSAGFEIGDQVVVVLDEGDVYYPYVVGFTATTLDLCPVLPYGVGRGIDEGVYFGLENTIVLWRRGGYDATFVLDLPCQDILDVDILAA